MDDQRVEIHETALVGGYRLGRVTLNNPKALNAVRLDMIQPMQQAIERWEADPAIVCIFIDAAGDKAFCAGGDIVSLYRGAIGEGDTDYPRDFFINEYRLCHDLHRLKTPVIAWGHGVVMGGGLGLFSGASHRVVTDTSKLAMPEIKIGLFPDVAATWYFNRMPRYIGLFLAMTGATLGPADALFTGLATHARRHDAKDALLAALAACQDWQHPQAAVSDLLDGMDENTISARPSEAPLIGRLDTLFDATRGPTVAAIAERITALAESDDAWLAAAAKNLAAGCPVTAHLIHRQLGAGRHLSLAEAVRQELAMALACCANADFPEGVRALLVDKDKNPQWSYPSIADVPASHIDAHFKAAWQGEHPLADL